MTTWMLISTFFAAEPAKTPPAKVYVVYVTVVEVDAAGNETVLFTPKVQTTGTNPAGATVEHVDGRTFEFNCKMAASPEPALERPPETPAAQKPFQLTVGSKLKESPATASPGPIRAAAKRSPSGPGPHGGEGAKLKPGDYSVRTYDVSALLDIAADKAVTEADFVPVIQTVKTITDAKSWDGPATIKPFMSTKSLVIKQTAAGHAAVAEALSKLKTADK